MSAVPATFKNYGWRVTFAGLGINLMLGILYTWSVIKGGVPAEWGWGESAKTLPYSVACLVFSIVMVPAGRMQDKRGPRLTATIGGLLVGLGMVISSLTQHPAGYTIGFGVLTGAGIGFGYASATPPAVKWFPAARTGLIAGIVVSGFGLASVYAAPLSRMLIREVGLAWTVRSLGIAFLVVVVLLAQLLRVPSRIQRDSQRLGPEFARKPVRVNFTSGEMLRTWQFYVLWFMYACGAGAGLMIISSCKGIVKGSGLEDFLATLVVSILAVGNGGGRIAAGVLSDKIGRTLTMFSFLVLQAVMLVLLAISGHVTFLTSFGALAMIGFLIGANYGSNLSLFPSMTKDYYGLKNFGTNYGLVFTAWGVGGFVLAQTAAYIKTEYEAYTFAYYLAAVLLIVAALLTFIVKPPPIAEHEAVT